MAQQLDNAGARCVTTCQQGTAQICMHILPSCGSVCAKRTCHEKVQMHSNPPTMPLTGLDRKTESIGSPAGSSGPGRPTHSVHTPIL